MPGPTPIRIAYILDNFFPKLGGEPTQNRRLIESLCTKDRIQPHVFPMIWKRGLSTHDFPYPVKPIRVYRNFPSDFNRVTFPIIWDRLITLLSSKKISSHLRNMDIIQTDLHSAAMVGAFYKYHWKNRLIIRFGGNVFREGETRDEIEDKYHPWKGIFFQWPARIALKSADVIIVNGQDLKEELGRARIDPHKIKIISLGLDHGIFYPPLPEKDILPLKPNRACHILFFGRITEANGPLHFLDIMGFLEANKRNAFRATIVGDGPLLSKMKEQAAKEKLTVTFLPPQPHEMVAELIRSSHFCVFPFRKIGGISSVVNESMACGRVVFVTDTGDLKNLIKHGKNGLLSPVDRPEEMAVNILRVSEDPDLQMAVARGASETITKEFNWDTIASKYASIYRGLLEEGRPSISLID